MKGSEEAMGCAGKFLPHLVLRVVAVLALLRLSETLDMTIFKSPKNVLLNTGITLECKVTDFGTSDLDLSNVGVRWLYGSEGKEIYFFNAGTVAVKRSGAKISETELRKGDASLYLPNIQLSEAGEYTCVVLVTPDKVQRSSQIVVLAKPRVLLSTQHITILNGSEKSVRCDATEFYPQIHEIFWEKISNGNAERLERDVCTGAAVSNNDGTFNVSSYIRIEPSPKDGDNIYRCTVRHQSLTEEISQTVKLTVQVSEPESTSVAAVVILALLALLFGLLFAGGVAYLSIFLKVAPKIIQCSEHQVFKHLEEKVVTWMVSPFRPCEVTIVIYAKRKQEDKRQLLKWSNKDWNENYSQPVSTNGLDCNETRILMQSDVENASFKPQITPFTMNKFKMSTVVVSVRIYPDISQDDGAELTIEVQHRSLKEPIAKTLTLDVKGVPPEVLDIVTPHVIKDKEPVALFCSVSGFKPRPLSIIWQQKRKNADLEELVRLQLDNTRIMHDDNKMNLKAKHHISEVEHEDKTYSIASVLEVVPDFQQDQNSQYICSILHHSTNVKREKTMTLSITVPPKLGTIKCEPAKLIAEEPVNLSCQIGAFFPRDITVKWLKDGSEILQNSVVTDAVFGQDGLYHCIANVKIVLTRADAETKYTCQVIHESLSKPIETHWVAGEVISLPKISKIKADPPCPEIGKTLTLSCTAYGFYPEANEIFWFKDSNKIQNPSKVGIVTQASKVDPSGLYSRSSQWAFEPTTADHKKEFEMQILHSETSSKPVTSNYCLELREVAHEKDFNSVNPLKEVAHEKDFNSVNPLKDRADKQDGSNRAKSEEVAHEKDFNSVNPLKDRADKQDGSNRAKSEEVAHEKDFNSVNPLKDRADKQDGSNRAKSEEVAHEKDSNSVKPLKDNAVKKDDGNKTRSEAEALDKVSDIKCLTKNPTIGQPVTLSCDVNGCALEEAHIIWYRDAYPFDEKEFVTNKTFEDASGFTTQLTYTPKAKDKHHIQVQLEFNLEEHMRQYNLEFS